MSAAAHLLRFSPLPPTPFPTHSRLSLPLRSLHLPLSSSSPPPSLNLSNSGGGGGGSGSGSGGSGGGSGPHGSDSNDSDDVGPFDFLLGGWRSRVSADPEFPFKVLMEMLVGVTSCVLGDMASRPNFGLNELDFVFSTLVVGSILNFSLMYLLAPAAGAAASGLPGFFSACPSGHMFEPGAYSLVERLGTLVYKGAVFGTVGFCAGLVGTAISNGLIALRKKMDPEFETPNKAPPTLLNSLTWAAHMGVSSNVRYQTLNGLEFLMAKVMPPAVFKVNVLVIRCLNNVLGGMSFVVLARLTGSQKSDGGSGGKADEKEKLIAGGETAVDGGDSELRGAEPEGVGSEK